MAVSLFISFSRIFSNYALSVGNCNQARNYQVTAGALTLLPHPFYDILMHF